MSGLIPIVLLGTLILIFGGRLLVQWSRRSRTQVVTIEDYYQARAALDSVFVETAAIKRIFANEDMEFISQGRIGDVRRFFLKHRFDGAQHGSGLRSVSSASDTEVVVGQRDSQLLEEDIGHFGVVVLTGVNQDLLVPGAECEAERRRLYELRAGTDYSDDLQGFTSRNTASRPAGIPSRMGNPRASSTSSARKLRCAGPKRVSSTACRPHRFQLSSSV